MKPFRQISILGLGLIGGSIALDVKKLRLAKRVVGYNRSPARRHLAKKLRACDEVTGDPRAAVRGADLVILATPVQTMLPLAKKIAPALEANALITDVGSTKVLLVKNLSKVFKGRGNYIGSHPIAGTEHSGMESALPGLFKNHWWLLTPQARTASAKVAYRRLENFIRALGAKPAPMSPEQHDRILAIVSHLPHMAAFALMETALNQSPGKALSFAGTSFRDFTRVASSSAQMWAEIAIENRGSLLPMLSQFERSLKKIQNKIFKKDVRGLQGLFAQASKVRRKI
jgi:prephenate dehydrogenase